jgi:hypothetical protein
MQTMKASFLAGAPVAVRPQASKPSRAQRQVVRAGQYDEELQQTAVSVASHPHDRSRLTLSGRLSVG